MAELSEAQFVEDTQERSAGSAPEVIDFDAAYEKARLAMLEAGVLISDVPDGEPQGESTEDPGEIDSDEEDTDDGQPSDDEDDDLESEDDEDDDEDDGESEDDAGLVDEDADEESEEGEPPAAEVEAEVEPDEKPRKKKGRSGRKIERLQTQFKDLQTQYTQLEETSKTHVRNAQALAAQLAQRDAAQAETDARIAAEVEDYLGGAEKYKQRLRDALNGDFAASEEVKEWDARREKYQEMKTRAEQVVHERAGEVFQKATEDLPGIDRNVLQTASLFNIVRHVYFTGLSYGRDEGSKAIEKEQAQAKTQVDKLKRENERLKARLESARPKAVSKGAPTPLAGGKPRVAGPKKSILDDLLDPSTRFPTDAAEELVRTGRLKLLEAS